MLYSDFLKNPRPCPFCHPGQRVISETGGVYLTYALAPYHRHHLLVLPRRHVMSLLELHEEEIRDSLALIKRGVQILEHLGYTDYSVLVRNGVDSGKSVEHLHVHVVPKVHLSNIDSDGGQRQVLSPDETEQVTRELLVAAQGIS